MAGVERPLTDEEFLKALRAVTRWRQLIYPRQEVVEVEVEDPQRLDEFFAQLKGFIQRTTLSNHKENKAMSGLRFIIEEADSGGYIVQEYGKRSKNDGGRIGGKKNLFSDWSGVRAFLATPPYQEPEEGAEK